MANRFWVLGSGTFDTTTTTNWSASTGGAGGASAPTTTDAAIFDANSGGGTVLVSTSAPPSVASLDMTNAAAMALSWQSSATASITINNGKLVIGANVTIANTAPAGKAFIFAATTTNGGAGWPITTAGKTLGPPQFSGTGGRWQLQDNLTWSGGAQLLHTAGTLDTNGKTIAGFGYLTSGAVARTLLLTSSTWNLSATSVSGAWSVSGSNVTITSSAETINLTLCGIFAGGGQTYATVTSTAAGVQAVTGANTFGSFTRTGAAVTTDGLTFASNCTFTTLVLNSNSATNRLLVSSATPGTQVTLTAGTLTATNVIDFMDIKGAGAATWTTGASGATYFGDCLGNSGITFTTPATQTCTMSTNQNASTLAIWTSRVPLPQDPVLYSGVSGGILTQDMPRIGASVDWSSATGSPTWTLSSVPSIVYGSLTLIGGMTLTHTQSFTLAGRSSHTITMAGKQFGTGNIFVLAPGGTYTQQDALTVTSNSFTWQAGTWLTGNFSMSATSFVINGSFTRVITLGTSTLTATSSSAGTVFNLSQSTTTWSAAAATFVIATASGNTRTFATAGITFGTLQYNVAQSPGALVLTGAGTFTTMLVGSGRILTLPSSTTTTIASGGSFAVNGQANGFVYLPGVAANYASAPDSAVLDITGNISFDIEATPPTWVPATQMQFIAKYGISTLRAYRFFLDTAGKLNVSYSYDGLSNLVATSSVATGLSAGSTSWVRGTLIPSDGAGHYVAKFYTSPDGTTWSQLGTTQTLSNAGHTAIFNSSAVLEIGSSTTGTAELLTGSVYVAKVYNSDVGSGAGTPVFFANFGTKAVGANSFTESSANAATVTINGSLAQAGDGRAAITSSTPGTTATLAGVATQLQNCDYLTIQDSAASPANTFYAGHHSTSVSNVSGWTFATGYAQVASLLTQAVTVLSTKGAGKNAALSQAIALSATKGAGKAIALTQGTTIASLKGPSKSSALTQGSTLASTKGAGKTGSFAQGVTLSVRRNVSKSIALAQGSSLAALRSVGKSGSFTQGTVLAVAKGVGRGAALLQGVLLAGGRGISRSAALLQGTTLSAHKAVGLPAALQQSTTLTATKGVGKLAVLTQGVILSARSLIPGAIRMAFAAGLRTLIFTAGARILTFAAASRTLIFRARGSYATGGDTMLSTPVGQGSWYIGTQEVAQPFVEDLADRLALDDGETLVSGVFTVTVQLPGQRGQVAVPSGFYGGYTLCGGVRSVTPGSPGSGYTQATAAVGSPPYPGYPAKVTPVIVNGAITSYVVSDPGLAYLTAPSFAVAGDGSGATGTPVVPMSAFVYLLGNANAVLGAQYFVEITFTTSTGRVTTVIVPPIPCTV